MAERTDSYFRDYCYYTTEDEKQEAYKWMTDTVRMTQVNLKALGLEPELLNVEFANKQKTQYEPDELFCTYCINHIERSGHRIDIHF